MKKPVESKSDHSTYYVEILDDTVSPTNVLHSIIISIVLGLGGFLIGQSFFPSVATEKMVDSFSLLLGIAGCVIALVLCAFLFRPKRILTESDTDRESVKKLLEDLQVDPQEELDVIKNDPAIRKEMEDLKIIDIFTPKEKGK